MSGNTIRSSYSASMTYSHMEEGGRPDSVVRYGNTDVTRDTDRIII